MAERARIIEYFAPLTVGEPGSFGLRDDAAVLTIPISNRLVITTDSVIQGIHVMVHATAEQFAQKLVRRNLSDLAAMGASPWRYTLNLHTPHGLSEEWFAQFTAALQAEQRQFKMILIGGDSTSGGGVIHATLTCFGLIDTAPLLRSGAQIGDDIYVSGTLGDAAFALSQLQRYIATDEALANRYHLPTPRIALGKSLQRLANSAIDISDGLLADAAQLCTASKCGARIELATLPISPWLKNAMLKDASVVDYALTGGDDYELLFTARPANSTTILNISKRLGLPLSRIGSITNGSEVQVIDEEGNHIMPQHTGWEHA